MVLRHEPVPRHLHLGGIAEQHEPIPERPANGVRADVQALDGVAADDGRRKVLEDVQDLERGRAAGGPGGPRQVHAAIAPPQHRLDPRLVRGQVAARDETARGPHLVVDGLGDRAPVEGVGPVAGDELETAREIGIARVITRLQRGRPVDGAAVAEVDAGRLGERRQLLDEPGRGQRLIPVVHEALAGERDRGAQHVGQLHRAEALEGQDEPRHGAGNPDRARAHGVGVVLDVRPREQRRGDAADHPVHRLVRGRGRDRVEVDGQRLVLGRQMDEHGPRAADGAHERLDDGHGERGGDGGVDGVAATGQDPRADLGPERMLGHDETTADQRGLLGHHQLGTEHPLSLRAQRRG